MKFYIKQNESYSNPIKYVLEIIAQFTYDELIIIQDPTLANQIFDHQNASSLPICKSFYAGLKENTDFIRNTFSHEPIIRNDEQKPDYIASLFFAINCIQEYSNQSQDYDEYGRYQFTKSWQKRFDKIEENLVLKYIREFQQLVGIKQKPSFRSKLFVSHDIDTVNGALFQDGLWLLKHKRFGQIFKLLFNEVTKGGSWNNIDTILKINSEYDIKATFFWLSQNGVGSQNVKNADYKISKQHKNFENITNASSFNGLHKSSMNLSFDQELELLPTKSTLNRNHFLKFTLPKHWNEIELSKITFDASLGFAEQSGFRNGFAFPFIPFNIEKDEKFHFVEMPLMVMDGTYQQYLKIDKDDTAASIISFFEKHQYDSILSFLWHNTHFTEHKYGGYLEVYKTIIKYFYDSKFEFTSPEDIQKLILK